MPPALPFLLILLPLLFPSARSQTSFDPPGCRPSLCGSTNISYPFWISSPSSQSSYCGYPVFDLVCLNNTTPILQILDRRLTVLHISTSRNTLTLVDSDLVSESSCPHPSRNLTLDRSSPVRLAHDAANITFLSNCSSSTTGSPMTCRPGSFVATSDQIGHLNGTCGEVVVVPVLREAVEEEKGDLGKGFQKVLRKGFQMEWDSMDLKDCKQCEDSHGRCGYRKENGEEGLALQCFCANGIHEGSCWDRDRGSQGRLRRKLLIAFGSLVGGFLLALCVVYLWLRRQKGNTRSVSQKALVRSVSTDPAPLDRDLEAFGSLYRTFIFTYEELQEATGGFDSSKELGDGGFGVVYKGLLRDGRVVAVKRLHERNYRRVQQFRNEVEILNRIRHPNLVSLYGCTTRDSRELLLVYEYVPNGTLADHLNGPLASENLLTWPRRLSIAVETAAALAYLHATQPQIIHRDVKTSNILLDDAFHVKVADFGLSRLFPSGRATHVSTAPQGTPGYVDPEYHQCYQLTDKSDVYSFGVVLVELISSKPAVDIDRPRSEINLSNIAMAKIPRGLVHELVDPTLGYDNDPVIKRTIDAVAELAFRCLQPEKDMRPSMDEVRDTLVQMDGGDQRKASPEGEYQTRDDASLLKSSESAAFSPVTVIGNWASISTTHSASP